jgi:predicted DNA-binding ArsR family transcriptional regulator
MSQAPAATYSGRQASSDSDRIIDAESEMEALFHAFDDDDCRAILTATTDGALTANEISDACDLPLSTAYRKLDQLTEAGLLDEQTRIRSSGSHASEYALSVDELVISLEGDSGLELQVSQREEQAQGHEAIFAAGD